MELVYPGELLKKFLKDENPSLKLGAYLRRVNDERELRSAVVGAYKKGSDGVIPRRGPYVPRLNDDVVGIVISEEPSYLRVDIRAPYTAFFRPAEPLETYPIGTVLWAKVVDFDLKRNPVLSTKRLSESEDYGIIAEGIIVEFSPNRIGAVLGPKLSYIKKIQEALGVKIYPGRNGRFVISGSKDAVKRVEKFLREVDKAPATRVVSVVKKFLSSIEQEENEGDEGGN